MGLLPESLVHLPELLIEPELLLVGVAHHDLEPVEAVALQ
jgi:hypothetical protein